MIASNSPAEALIAEQLPPRFGSPWMRGYARGKLLTDPLYRASFERMGHSPLPLLDVGCGAGLHAFYLRERGYFQPVLGLDVDPDKIQAGTKIASRYYRGLELRVCDGAALPEFSGNVTLLDVLQYFPAEAQGALLEELAARVAPGGWCIIRTTPHDHSLRFCATWALEWTARLIGWMKRPAMAFPALESIAACFPKEQFDREIRPMWGRTPFNSWLLAFRRRAAVR